MAEGMQTRYMAHEESIASIRQELREQAERLSSLEHLPQMCGEMQQSISEIRSEIRQVLVRLERQTSPSPNPPLLPTPSPFSIPSVTTPNSQNLALLTALTNTTKLILPSLAESLPTLARIEQQRSDHHFRSSTNSASIFIPFSHLRRPSTEISQFCSIPSLPEKTKEFHEFQTAVPPHADWPSAELDGEPVATVLNTGLTPSALHHAVAHHAPKLVTPEQVNNFISNLNLLDQIGSYELNHIFAHSQRLNSDAIVSFVKALCKVAMSELQSPTDPRVFSLATIVEVAHYNMNRIRLVWSRRWNVLSDFFVSVGLTENLSVAIFVLDSLRQLAMKFLEREELANYKFHNEFLRPFVVVMQKSNSAEIRELIVRCISQMNLLRVSNVKSGWKSVFMVFTAAAADERKSVVALAFETMEKIVRKYFLFITEMESTTFTDCVRCLFTFTSSRFNSDVSLNAIAFLRFCAVKLAEVGLVCNEDRKDDYSYILAGTEGGFDGRDFTTKELGALNNGVFAGTRGNEWSYDKCRRQWDPGKY